MPNLNDAIEGLYRVFAVVPKPKHLDGCPCCIDRKGIGTLLRKSLRAITPDELSSYAFSAFLTVGDVADYFYFLPRILEISATEPAWWPGPEVIGQAIRTTRPMSWSDPQRSALNDYLVAVFGNAIEIEAYYQIDSWMCAVARIGLDVQPYLAQIATCPAAVLDYFETNAESLPRNVLANAFWELPCPGHDAIVDWFFSPEIVRIPFEAYGCVLTRGN